MNANVLAAQMIKAMGGKVTPARLKAFQAMAGAIIEHIRTTMIVTSSGVDPQGGVVASISSTIT